MSHIILFIILAYGFVLAIFYFFQEKFLFYPGNIPFGDCPEMEKYEARAEHSGEVRYYFKAAATAKSWMIVFHGNAGNACERTYFFDLLKPFDSHVVLFEYPGYGGDKNTPGESRIVQQAKDLILHLERENTAGLPIYLMGESLGTGAATCVASCVDVDGLILVSAYTSIADVAKKHYPWLPVKLLLRHQFQADRWAKQTKAPVLLFHGTDDNIIPVGFARRQVQNFKGEKRLVEISGCGHNDILDLGERMVQKEISSFISQSN